MVMRDWQTYWSAPTSLHRERLWSLAVGVQEMLHFCYAPVVWQAGRELDLSEANAARLTFVLGNFDVAPLSADLLWARWPHNPCHSYEALLRALSDAGLLQEGKTGIYRLTDHARRVGWRLFAAKHSHLGDLEPLPALSLTRLASLLHRLVHASRVTAEPPAKRWLLSRCSYLVYQAPPLAQIAEYLEDLAAFRDDCYLAAREQLAKHTIGDMAVGQLAAKWGLCHDVEPLADAFFYAPWICLNKQEQDELAALLTDLSAAF